MMRSRGAGVTLAGMPDAVAAVLEQHRQELTRHCRRVMGTSFEAEDAVQETIVRAWHAIDRFEGRSALRSWLYRIATNVCLDMLGRPQRRARPVADIEPPPTGADPADVAASHEAIRLALASALAHLPARQRAMLILVDALHWRAREVAELLDTSEVAVYSAVQRARATLASRRTEAPPRLRPEQTALLSRYAERFERHDIAALVSLIRDDAVTDSSLNLSNSPVAVRGSNDRSSNCRSQ
jgi:RNA polymerase sigma-70 factor, ECF subfamily